MGVEIERRYCVLDSSWRSAVVDSREIVQGYITSGSATEAGVRARVIDEQAFLTLKSGAGIKRFEYEYEIPKDDALSMIRELCGARMIRKTRHSIVFEGHDWVVDEFLDNNQGLVLAEIELQSVDEPFALPIWAGIEVTEESCFVNAALASNPFKGWLQADIQRYTHERE